MLSLEWLRNDNEEAHSNKRNKWNFLWAIVFEDQYGSKVQLFFCEIARGSAEFELSVTSALPDLRCVLHPPRQHKDSRGESLIICLGFLRDCPTRSNGNYCNFLSTCV